MKDLRKEIIEILQEYIFADGDIWVIYDLKKMYDNILPKLDEIFAPSPMELYLGAKLKEELIAYEKWTHVTPDHEFAEMSVNTYLKQRNNG